MRIRGTAGCAQDERIFARTRLSIFAIAGLLSVLVASCSLEESKPVLKVSKDKGSFTISSGGAKRRGTLFVPSGYDGSRSYSLVIGLHGANGSGQAFGAYGFNRLAEGLEWIMAYPDGVGGRWESPGEIPFMANLIDGLEASFRIDPERVYLTGHSAGAIFAYETAAALPGKIAAIAPVAGLMRAAIDPRGVDPVSVLHVQAIDDAGVPFGGDETYGLLSAPASVEFWRGIDRASDTPTVFLEAKGIKGSLWRGPAADAALLEYRSGGHSWLPGATDFIADFFYNHPPRANRLRIGGIPADGRIEEFKPFTLEAIIEKPATVLKVEYFSEGKLLGDSSEAPYSFLWENPFRGRHSLSAVATLKDGTRIASTMDPSIIASRASADKGIAKDPPLQPVSAKASSIEEPQYAARFAIDGNILTRWSSSWKDGQSLTLDLGFERRVGAVSLFWESAYAREYSIELSADGNRWKRVALRADGAGNEEYLEFPPETARYVRMSGKTRGTEYGFSLWEIIVHGK